MRSIMPAFVDFPDEGAIVGRILAGYGELELALCICVGNVKNDFSMVFKAMFRPRGESRRIAIADGIGREAFKSIDLDLRFAEAIGEMKHCLKIRNLYAHCHWTSDFGQSLGFLDLEKEAAKHKRIEKLYSIPTQDLSLPLLKQQEEFFCYTHDYFWGLSDEAATQAGRSSSSPRSMPKKVQQPPLHSQ